MPSESQRIRARAWLQERTPLAELTALLRKKAVPLHAHYLWYFLGSMILVALTVQVVTGILLVIYYQPGVSENAAVPGAYESVRQIVTKLPHGWWIRSLHHWSAHLMIASVLLHLLSVLLLKAYRRPREVIWWTGLVLCGLTLTAGFTGYLLPWNSLSFTATRVGGGIAAATPVAGPLIRELLLGGPDVSGLTLTRFFGLHVVVIPLLILATVGLHLVLILFHGSSVPPSVRHEASGGEPSPAVRFWPDFSLRDLRLAVLVLAVVMVVSFLLPPVLGVRADPMAPTPPDIKPEWYFFPVFKMLKLMPDRILGLENLHAGILLLTIMGLTLFALPLLDTGAVETSTSRRRAAVRRRLLLLAGAALGWAALIAPLRLLLVDGWPDRWREWQATAVGWAPAAAGVIWLAVAFWFERRAARHSGAPATLFGWVLVSAIVGYTMWEGLGPRITLWALAALWLGLLAIQWPKAAVTGARVRLCKVASIVLVLGALYGTVVLGGLHQEAPADLSTPAAVSTGDRGVPRERRSQTVGLLAGGLCACVFLLVILELRIRLQRQAREMGLTA